MGTAMLCFVLSVTFVQMRNKKEVSALWRGLRPEKQMALGVAWGVASGSRGRPGSDVQQDNDKHAECDPACGPNFPTDGFHGLFLRLYAEKPGERLTQD